MLIQRFILKKLNPKKIVMKKQIVQKANRDYKNPPVSLWLTSPFTKGGRLPRSLRLLAAMTIMTQTSASDNKNNDY